MNTIKQHDIQWTSEQSARIWDYYGSNPHYADTYFTKIFGEAIYKSVSNWINFQDKDVIDFGSGPGFIAKTLFNSAKIKSYTAIDFSKSSIEALEQNYGQHAAFKNAVFINDLPSPVNDNLGDILLLIEVVEHLNDEELHNSLSEAKRLLKRGGKIIITTPHNEDLDKNKIMCPSCACVFHKWQHQRSWTKDNLQNTLNQHGFKADILQDLNWSFHKGPLWKRTLKKIYANLNNRPNPHLLYIGTKY